MSATWPENARQRSPSLRTAGVVILCMLISLSVFVMAAAYRATPGVVALAQTRALPLRLEDFPPGYLDILLAVEDPGFYTHPGVDLITPGAGFTTITQGLVKQLFFGSFGDR